MFQYISHSCSPLSDVSCVFRESCVLPCPFSPETDPMIHWTKEPEYTPVHSYYRNQHLLHLQHESYRNRTSLSDQGIRTADASLQLHKVNVSDEGRYNFDLHSPVLNVSVSQEGQQLICSSERIYPEPTVAWTPPSSDSYQTQTSVNATEDGLYTVYSSLKVILNHMTCMSCILFISWKQPPLPLDTAESDSDCCCSSLFPKVPQPLEGT
uniref:Ig-like domain-containing protein n=1 Tax=Neogobius melanostomus TaxID=47308 RepID=A0A8C6SVI4_9GOBI